MFENPDNCKNFVDPKQGTISNYTSCKNDTTGYFNCSTCLHFATKLNEKCINCEFLRKCDTISCLKEISYLNCLRYEPDVDGNCIHQLDDINNCDECEYYKSALEINDESTDFEQYDKDSIPQPEENIDEENWEIRLHLSIEEADIITDALNYFTGCCNIEDEEIIENIIEKFQFITEL